QSYFTVPIKMIENFNDYAERKVKNEFKYLKDSIMIDEVGLHINLIYLRLKAVESELRDRKAKCKRELPEFETDNSDALDEIESRSFASSNCSDILLDVVAVKKIHDIMSKTEKVSAANLKNLAYNILKNFNDDVVKNKTFPELANCTECDKKIFARPNKTFTTLLCGYIYHRICIEKKLLLSKQLTCPTLKCGKSVEILEEFTELDSQSSTSSIVGKMGKQLTIQSQKIIDEEMPDVDNGENKDKVNSKGIGADITEGAQKRPIEVTSEETSTMVDKSPSKKAKKEVKPVDREKSVNLKKLIDELLSKYHPTQIVEIAEVNVPGGDSTNFLYFFRKIDYAESKNEVTNRDVISSYFDLGDALYKRYKEYKKDNGKEASNALVFDDVRNQISEVSDGALRKRMERARKIYKLFTTIVNGDEKLAKQKIALIRSFSLRSITNLNQGDIDFVIVKCLRGNKDAK
ncbi:5491_t:CDS:2, partial [Diversispora eburnea]